MKFIAIPVDLMFGNKPWSFRSTVEQIVDNDAVFLRPASNARAAQRLLASLDAATGDIWVIANDDDHKLLTDAAERWDIQICGTVTKPDGKQESFTLATRHFLPHLDAIAEARVNDPRHEIAPAVDPISPN